jgi:sulfur carrier protein
VNVVVNGTPTPLPDGATVRDLLAELEVPAEGRGVAVAVDAQVVPRAQWEGHALADGATVEVVRAVQGG